LLLATLWHGLARASKRAPTFSALRAALGRDSAPLANTHAAVVRSLARTAWGVFVPSALTVPAYGAYSILQTTAAVVSQIGVLGAPQTILREPPRSVPLGGLLLHSVLVAAVALAVMNFLAPVTGGGGYYSLLGALALAQIAYATLLPRARAAGAFREVLRAEWIGAAFFGLAIAVSLMTGAAAPRSHYGRFVVLETLATLIVLASLALSHGTRIGDHDWRLAGLSRVLRSVYSVGVLVLLDVLIWRRLELYFLQASPDGLKGVAVFGLASQVATLALLVPGAMLEAWSPGLAAVSRTGRDAFVARLRENQRIYLPTFAAITVGALALTPVLVHVLFARYVAWMWYILAFVLIRVACGYAGFYSAALYATKRERALYVPVLAGGTIGVLSNTALTLRWGLSGAVAAYALTQGTVALATWFAFRRGDR
jgi:O-antigen/teichoic acid export membrane protein